MLSPAKQRRCSATPRNGTDLSSKATALWRLADLLTAEAKFGEAMQGHSWA